MTLEDHKPTTTKNTAQEQSERRLDGNIDSIIYFLILPLPLRVEIANMLVPLPQMVLSSCSTSGLYHIDYAIHADIDHRYSGSIVTC